nr:PadR family transcriptional regulator [uncultured Sellimonas sp.]
MIPSQMLKGILEGCLLKIISDKPIYGYEITQQFEAYGFGQISEGTVYPLLLRMEKNGWITSSYRESLAGPKRRYFSIEKAGIEELERFQENWNVLERAVNFVLKGDGFDEETK